MEAQRNIFEEVPPLENHVILELIFKHCTFQDLKSCQQVCSLWRDTSLRAWRSSVVRKIAQSVSPAPIPNDMDAAPGVKLIQVLDFSHGVTGSSTSNVQHGVVALLQFLRFVQDEDNYFKLPYSNFTVYEEIDPFFWTAFGPQIKSLKLQDYKMESLTNLCQIVINSCPNLEELSLQNIVIAAGDREHDRYEMRLRRTIDFERRKYVGSGNKNLKSLTIIEETSSHQISPFCPQISRTELLSCCPNLKVLKYQGPYHILEKIFMTIRAIREQDPNKLKLETVNIDNSLYHNNISPTENVLQVLKDPGLNLKGLSIQFNGPERAKCLREVLENHVESLERLCLYSGGFNTAFNPKEILPEELQFESLKELVLHAGVFQNMTFLRLTPNLESLELVGGFRVTINDASNMNMNDLSLVRLRDLKLRNSTLGQCEFSRLADWMPFVDNLIISRLRNESFEVVCERWPNLVTFEIYKSFISDEGITGLSSEDVKRINEEGSNGTWTPITVRRANITLLTGLRSFSMNPYSDHHSSDLGYCASAYGFKQLRRLDTLKLENYRAYCHQV